jgi:hypothetical protein
MCVVNTAFSLFSYGPVVQLPLTFSSSSSRHFYPSLFFRLMHRVSTFKRSTPGICNLFMFYNKNFSLMMTSLRSKHVALKDIYLVVLTVHVHNNDTVTSLRRMYAVFRTSRHRITSQKIIFIVAPCILKSITVHSPTNALFINLGNV